MRNATLKQLRAVLAIQRSGRIVNAARELNLTTPAITSQLKLLEEELGITLFDRTHAGMRLTAAGEEVYRTALKISDALRDCEERLDDLRGLRGGVVTVGAVSTAKYFAPRLMVAFTRVHPHLELQLNVGNRGVIFEALRDYTVDLAITGRPPGDIDVEATPFGSHPLIVIAPSDHAMAKRRAIPREALAGERFLIREPGSGTRAAFEASFGGLGAPALMPGMEIASNETIKQAVIAGLGIALISGHTVAAEIADGRLVALDIVGMPVMREWYAVRRSDRTLSSAAASFFAFLQEGGADFLPPPMLFKASAAA